MSAANDDEQVARTLDEILRRLERLQTDVGALGERVERLERGIDARVGAAIDAQTGGRADRRTRKQLQAEVKAAAEQRARLEATLAEQGRRLAEADRAMAAVAGLDAKVATLATADRVATLDTRLAEVARLAEAPAVAPDELAGLAARVDDVAASQERSVAWLRDGLASARDEATTRAGEVEARLGAAIADQAAALSSARSEQAAALSQVQSELAATATAVAALGQRHDATASALEHRVAELDQAVGARIAEATVPLAARINEADAARAATLQRIDDVAADLQATEATATRAAAEAAAATVAAAAALEAKDRIDALATKVDHVEATANGDRAQLTALAGLMGRLRDDHQAGIARVTKLETDLTNVRSQAAETQAAAVAAFAEVRDETGKEIARLDADRVAAKAEIATVAAAAAAVKAETDKAMRRVDDQVVNISGRLGAIEQKLEARGEYWEDFQLDRLEELERAVEEINPDRFATAEQVEAVQRGLDELRGPSAVS